MAADDVIIIENKELIAVQVPAAPELVAAGAQGPGGTFPPSQGSGIAVVNAGGYLARTLVSLTAALAITNANGVAGNPTLALVGTLASDYGITDVYTKTAADARYAPIAVPWASITGTPTTVAGYGITDVYTKTQSDVLYPSVSGSYVNPAWIVSLPWSKITATPTTRAGYGITDAQPLAADLTSLSGFGASTGYPKRTASTPTWVVNATVPWGDVSGQPTTLVGYGITDPVVLTSGSYANPAWLTSLAWSKITGTPTTATGYGIVSIDSVPVGATTASTGAFTTLTASTSLGIGGNVTLFGDAANVLAQRNGTNAQALRVYNTYTDASNYERVGLNWSGNTFSIVAEALGTGTTRSINIDGNGINFKIAGSAAWGINGSGHLIVNATDNTRDVGATGNRPRAGYFGSCVQVNATSSGNVDAAVRIGGGGSHQSTATIIYGTLHDEAAPSTATNTFYGYFATLRTAAAAFTIINVVGYEANQVVLGAGSTITNVYGFRATSTLAGAGSNTFGFYSNLAQATSVQQLRMAGTADSMFNGSVIVSGGGTGQTFMFGLQGTHANTAATLYGHSADVIYPSTTTTAAYVYRAVGRTVAAAFTLTSLAHYYAENVILGSGSAITSVMGFYAGSSIAGIASNTYGFRSDLNSAASVWAFYGNGTADSSFGGGLFCRSASSGIGYATGAGGTVTQATSKSTGVTLSKNCGQITMNAAALAAGARVSFVVTNTSVAATDMVDVAVVSGGTANAYSAMVTAIAAGSFTITVKNETAGSLSEAPVIGFSITKGVTA